MSLSDGFFESGSQQVGPNGCDHKGAKVVLVPAHIFIDDCPFFWGFAVILLEVGVGFLGLTLMMLEVEVGLLRLTLIVQEM